MAIAEKVKSFFKTPFRTALTLLAVAGFFTITLFASAQIIDPNDGGIIINPPVSSSSVRVGSVYGWGWMGTGITDPNLSQGGGGWINFNCAPANCTRASSWGVSMDLAEGSRTYGAFRGNAWSSNYGWLSFEPDVVESCWINNPAETFNGTVKVINLADNSFKKPLVGWAKFISGDDFPNDGFDGCVSFSGTEYAVLLDINTGVLEGWAWGGPVTGWMSFSNPECPFCTTAVVLDGVADIEFWASDSEVVRGGGTVLNWAAVSSPSLSITSCSTYSNDRNYGHWMNTNNTVQNVGEISARRGNIPGTHSVNGINDTVTYSIQCTKSNGTLTAVKYATVRVVDEDTCTDRLALNFGQPGECVYSDSVPSVSLNVITNFPPNYLPIGSSNEMDYNASPRWTFTNPSLVNPNSCTQKFFDHNGVERNLEGWTGADFIGQTVQASYATVTNPDEYATLPGIVSGSRFTYRINCLDTSGGPLSAVGYVVFRDIVLPPSSTTLQLDVEPSLFTIGNTPYRAGPITWRTNNPSDIARGSCVGSFDVNGSSRNLTGWTGGKASPNPTASLYTGLNQLDMTSIVSGAESGDVLRFTISCESVGGLELVATDTIIVRGNSNPPSEPLPIVDLRVLSPNEDLPNNLFSYELLPPNGAMVNLGWSISNADTCTGSSQMIVNGSPESNNLWNGSTFVNTPLSTMNMDMSSGSLYHHTTMFTITCQNSEGGIGTDSARVVIEGQPCPSSLPACAPQPGSTLPGYVEF